MDGAGPDLTGLDTPPSPDGGWSEALELLQDAVVMPATQSLFQQPAGVLHADGGYCATGAYWRNHRPLSLEPPAPQGPVARLDGHWLWGGVLWVHFGHFLVESSGRLWALDRVSDLAGVLFIAKRPKRGGEIAGFQRAFWDLCGVDVPVRVLTEPTEVAHLTVPGQGFGLGEIIRGTPSFRGFAARRFARDIAPDGPERLYISRSKLGLGKGGLVGEDRLEAYLAAEGYEIFHPQEHDLATQVARYRAASHIVAAEGSALHLFGLVGRASQKVAVVVRRRSGATGQIAAHLESFCGIEPRVVETLQSVWKRKGGHKARHDLGVLNLPALQTALREGGFAQDPTPWEPLRWPMVRRIVQPNFEKRTG